MTIGKMLVTALTVLSLSTPALAAREIVINGSTTVLPVMQKAGEAFMASHPGVQLSISGGGSGNGIKALIDKQCDVAMSSRDIKGKEKAAADKNGVTPVRTAIAVDAIVPVVHPSNTVSGLTTQQLRDIYTGKITNWKELGGADAKIVIISRDTSSGTFECWEELVMNKERVTPAALMQASAQTALSKQWPVARELYIFTDGQPTGEVKALVDYLLDPGKGQKSVREVGYVPLAH